MCPHSDIESTTAHNRRLRIMPGVPSAVVSCVLDVSMMVLIQGPCTLAQKGLCFDTWAPTPLEIFAPHLEHLSLLDCL